MLEAKTTTGVGKTAGVRNESDPWPLCQSMFATLPALFTHDHEDWYFGDVEDHRIRIDAPAPREHDLRWMSRQTEMVSEGDHFGMPEREEHLHADGSCSSEHAINRHAREAFVDHVRVRRSAAQLCWIACDGIAVARLHEHHRHGWQAVWWIEQTEVAVVVPPRPRIADRSKSKRVGVILDGVQRRNHRLLGGSRLLFSESPKVHVPRHDRPWRQ